MTDLEFFLLWAVVSAGLVSIGVWLDRRAKRRRHHSKSKRKDS